MIPVVKKTINHITSKYQTTPLLSAVWNNKTVYVYTSGCKLYFWFYNIEGKADSILQVVVVFSFSSVSSYNAIRPTINEIFLSMPWSSKANVVMIPRTIALSAEALVADVWTGIFSRWLLAPAPEATPPNGTLPLHSVPRAQRGEVKEEGVSLFCVKYAWNYTGNYCCSFCL